MHPALQLIHVSAVHSSRYEALGKFGEHSRSIFRALQLDMKSKQKNSNSFQSQWEQGSHVWRV